MSSGPLLVIGGAEDKTGTRQVLARFAKLAGGASARIAVVATASSLGDEIIDAYREAFGAVGVSDIVAPRPRTRAEAADPAHVADIDGATGVFMTGGNQSTLSGVVTGTPFGAAIKAAHARGAVVGGTSAGASVQSEHMVAFGRPGATPKLRMAQMSAGLGLLPGLVIDQHFDQRNRYGRLLTLVSHAPHLLGMGVDEDTAAIITDTHLEVTGRGAVTLFDGRWMTSNVDTARGSSALLASGVILHSLPSGSCFDLEARVLLPGLGGRPDDLRETHAVRTGTLEHRIDVEGALGDQSRT
ncbi:MAG: cyanophycinase [Frankiales bacterium]|nr:cyanophycinase [Frankiales bacterium]